MKQKIILPLLASAPFVVASQNLLAMNELEENWGVGIGVRSATMSYKTSGNTTNDVIPLLFYRGEQAYLDGASGGYHLYQNEHVSLGLAAQLRFFDIPRFAQNDIQGTQIDFGGKAIWHYSDDIDVSLKVMSDNDGRIYSNLTGDYKLEGEGWDATLYASVRATSSRFNTTYYGLQMEDLNSGLDTQIGVKGRTHLYQNLYAVGHFGATFFGHDTYTSQAIDSHGQFEGYLGFAMFGSSPSSSQPQLPEGAYMRLASGIATESGPSEVFRFKNDTDPERNGMTSVFYGHPLAGSVFGWPLDFYLTPGFVYHHSSNVQDAFEEYVLAIKGYYTFDWSVRTRLGFAEGISYSTDISHIERKNLAEKGYDPSKLMNYLDFSVDVNVGDLLKRNSLDNLWLGYSLHHRSGIFTTTSAFGRIKGGSDYNTLYLQYHF